MVVKVVSGGQSGVDRAAVDAAMATGLQAGGWCPRGRRAEDGPLDPRYPLQETPSEEYAERTSWNVRDSDATLILTTGEPTGGTAFTVEVALRLGRRSLVVDLATAPDPRAVCDWLVREKIDVLNVAGPRESGSPGVHALAFAFLRDVFRLATVPPPEGP